MTEPYRYSAHLGYLFTELPFEERFQAARDAGFAAVEYPSPYSVPADQMAEWLRRAGLSYVQFGLRSGDASRGEKGIAIFPDHREEFRANLLEGLNYAEAIGVKMVHAMAGVQPKEATLPEHRACYIENLAIAAQEAEKRGIRVIVEAMSPAAVPDYYLPTATSARDAITEAGHRNLSLLLDIFHTVSVGDDPIHTIHDSRDLIAHVHIADYPGRHEPGSGMIDYHAVRSTLSDVGYSGYLGCEYVPAANTARGLAWMTGSTSK